MKIAERFFEDDGKIIHQETHDYQPVLDRARMMRDRGPEWGESRHVASIPSHLFFEWLKEAGVSPSDTKAAEEVLKRKLMSGEFSAFRNWEGNW